MAIVLLLRFLTSSLRTVRFEQQRRPSSTYNPRMIRHSAPGNDT
ncbi:hypothetical protein T08_12024 [Trichinella sp. T8]|nr:hypothetical protein T08_12024 [Trichinella sp. T8]